MPKWEIRVNNANDYAIFDKIAKIKAILPGVRKMGLGGLKESALFVKGEKPLTVSSKDYVREIIGFCDDYGLNLEIYEIRRITAKEFDALAFGE